MSRNLPVIINHSLPDMLKARRGRARTGLVGRGGPRRGKVPQGLTTARRSNPSECCASLGPAMSGVESMGEVRHGKHWQGLLTAGWFLTRNHSGGNTKRIGMPGKRRECRGMARKAMEWQGLFTAGRRLNEPLLRWQHHLAGYGWEAHRLARMARDRQALAGAVNSGVNVQ